MDFDIHITTFSIVYNAMLLITTAACFFLILKLIRKNQQLLVLHSQVNESDVKKQETERLNAELTEDKQKLELNVVKYRSELAACISRIKDLKGIVSEKSCESHELQEAYQRLQGQFVKVKTQLEEKETYFKNECERHESTKKILKQEFENLANGIFDSKQKSFNETSQQSLSAMLSPFKDEIAAFREKLENMHINDVKQQAELNVELSQIKLLNQRLTNEAHHLATALKGQKKMQGVWGEMILDKILEQSGLRENVDYKREVSITRASGERARPDVIIFLPHDKHLIIDSKVSLNAYTRYINADDAVQKKKALDEHVSAIKNRMKELIKKDYTKLPGLNTPDIVFMFVPIESAIIEAAKADPNLLANAIDEHVLVTTPSTLLTSLQIVRQLWRYEQQNRQSFELTKRAESIYEKTRCFLESFYQVKESLEKTTEIYMRSERQLYSGRGNLIKQMEAFKLFAPTIQSQLPKYFTDASEVHSPYQNKSEQHTQAASDELA